MKQLFTSLFVFLFILFSNAQTNNPPSTESDSVVSNVIESVWINVLYNDWDGDGDLLSAPSIATQPMKGTVFVNDDYTIQYTPTNSSWPVGGYDSFQYVVCDTLSQFAPQPLCDTAICIVRLGIGTVVSDSIYISNPIGCHGYNNGVIQIFGTNGGIPAYRYIWNNGDSASSSSGLVTGMYSLTITDLTGNKAVYSLFLPEPDSLFLSVSHTFSGCSQAMPCEGKALANVIGGTPPYFYNWSNATGQDSIATGVCYGNNFVEVTDGMSCNSHIDFYVDSSFNLQVNEFIQDVNCNDSTAIFKLTNNNGFSPLSFYADGPVSPPTFVGDSFSINGVHEGPINFYILDSMRNCHWVNYVYSFVNNFHPHIDSLFNKGCRNINDGAIYLSNPNSSSTAISYLWNTGDTTSHITHLDVGTYYVTVSNGLGCIGSSDSFLITQEDKNLWTSSNSYRANCSSSGTVMVNAYGGTPPYTYLWNTIPPQATNEVHGLNKGNYSFTVTTSTGCFRTGTVNLDSNCLNVIYGNLFVDNNGNCVRDANEYIYSTHEILEASSNSYMPKFTSIQQNGTYSLLVDQGQWKLRLNETKCWDISYCGGDSTFFPTVGGDSIRRDIAVRPSTKFDLGVHPGWSSSNPGFNTQYWIYPWNYGTDTVNATVVIRYDSNLVYTGSTPVGIHNQNNHTITWTINQFPPSHDWLSFNSICIAYFNVPTSLQIGDSLDTEFWIYPTSGDCDTSNNYEHDIRPITSSQDPNEKIAEPSGALYPADSIITYTVHFQNTGNDTTTFIVLKDTLSPYLDPASFRMLASSHSYTFTMKGEGVLNWRFDPIFLPDSATNPQLSQGFVKYSVHTKHHLPVGTIIKNSAAIYFDYNSAIYTNTTQNIVSAPNGIGNEKNEIAVKVYPNPFTANTTFEIEGGSEKHSIVILDITGRVLHTAKNIEHTYQFSRDALSSGVYLFEISNAVGGKYKGKLVIE